MCISLCASLSIWVCVCVRARVCVYLSVCLCYVCLCVSLCAYIYIYIYIYIYLCVCVIITLSTNATSPSISPIYIIALLSLTSSSLLSRRSVSLISGAQKIVSFCQQIYYLYRFSWTLGSSSLCPIIKGGSSYTNYRPLGVLQRVFNTDRLNYLSINVNRRHTKTLT